MKRYAKQGSLIGGLILRLRRWRIHRSILKTGLRSRTVDFENIKFHYYCSENGRPPLVLLHGFLDSSQTFRRLFQSLSERYDLYALDLPGFGGSCLPDLRELWHIDSMSRITARFLMEELKLQGADLLSHSLGGLMALHMQRYIFRQKQISLFGRMSLIAPGIMKLPKERRDEVRRRLFPESAEEIKELLYKLYYKNHPDLHPIVIQGLLREWGRLGYFYLAENTVEDEDSAFFTIDELKKIPSSIRLFWGENDEITPLKIARAVVKKLPRIKLILFKNSGHALHLEEPDRFLEEFLITSSNHK